MTVKYEENNEGIFWVDGDQKGEPQKDLRHAMDDYELTVSGRKEVQRDDEGRSGEGRDSGEGVRVHTGDDGAAGSSSGGLIADNLGSAGESSDGFEDDDEEADGR
jgi:hypothetical protein